MDDEHESASGPTTPDDLRMPPRNPLQTPAIWLLGLAVGSLGMFVASPPGLIARIPASVESGGLGIFDSVVDICVLTQLVCGNLAIIVGAVCMLRLRSRAMCWIAAIVSVLPMCSAFFVVGIPFGIWAIVVLCRDDTRARFR